MIDDDLLIVTERLDPHTVLPEEYQLLPDNAASQAIIRTFGFEHRGQQLDEVDGPEDIYELSAREYRRRFLA